MLVGVLSARLPSGLRRLTSAAKTPKPICDLLERVFNEIAVAPDTVKFLATTGSDPMPGDSKKLRELLLAETKAWEGYVKLAKIQPQ